MLNEAALDEAVRRHKAAIRRLPLRLLDGPHKALRAVALNDPNAMQILASIRDEYRRIDGGK